MNPSGAPIPSDFTTDALISAGNAFGGRPGELQDWATSVLDAVEGLTDDRGGRRVDPALLKTFRSTAKFLQQPITPFDGLLEAPNEVIAAYQANKAGLHELRSTRTEVLTAVFKDLSASVMVQLQGVTWHDLEALGAKRHQPPAHATSEEDF